MSKKTAKNESLAYSILRAGSMAYFGYKLMFNFFPGHTDYTPATAAPGELVTWAGGLTAGTATLMLGHDYISSLPWRRLKVAFETTGLYIQKEGSIRLPHLRKKHKKPWGWELWYKLPIGMSLRQIEGKREELEQAIDGEIVLARRENLARVEILQGEIPIKFPFDIPEDIPGEIPFIVGQSRQGLITRCLTSCPHLLIAGTTGAGKSNALHTITTTILTRGHDVNLNIIDLKRVEFGYLRPYARSTHTLPGAIQLLEYLTGEMYRRMEILDPDYENAGEWRKEHPDRKHELPYEVLVVDEFAEVCPNQAPDDEKEMRKYAHNMLKRLIALARALGIHIVIATQYPNKDILPGILKVNMPAKIGFCVGTDAQSRVILDNGRAALLPSTDEIPGRAIFKHGIEREVQAPFLPLKKAKKIIREHFAGTGRKPPTLESTALPAPGIFKDLPEIPDLPDEEVTEDDNVSESISHADSRLPDGHVSTGEQPGRPGAFTAED